MCSPKYIQNYQKIISGVPQGSILGSIFFNPSINNGFFFLSDNLLQNFADELIAILQSGSKIVNDS